MQGKWSYPSADYFDISTAVHQLFLEDVDNRIEIEGTRRTKAYKEAKEENPDKLVLPTSDFNLTTNMVEKLKKVPQLEEFMSGFAEQRPEVAATATVTPSKGNTISVKGKADMLLSDGFGVPVLMDLKTSAKDLNQWKRNAYEVTHVKRTSIQTSSRLRSSLCGNHEDVPLRCRYLQRVRRLLKERQGAVRKSITQYETLLLEDNFKPYSAITGVL